MPLLCAMRSEEASRPTMPLRTLDSDVPKTSLIHNKMKNIILIICGILTLGLTGCKNDASKNNSDIDLVYQCPMKCEGHKTYDEAGSCPVCRSEERRVGKECRARGSQYR